MPQMQLPLFSEDVTLINATIGYAKRSNTVYYFSGQLPVYSHHEKDEATFKVYMAQLYVNGTASQAEINRAFGMNPINMKRWVARYQKKGPAGFYTKERRTVGRVVTEEVASNAQEMLDEGHERSEVAKVLGMKINTLGKAIRDGRLHSSAGVKKKKQAGVIRVVGAGKIAHQCSGKDVPA
jgi:hypothetical protein